MIKKLKGIYNDLSNNEYHAEKNHLSSSNLKLLLKDIPKFYKEKILGDGGPQKENPAFSEGNYAHSLILEPQNIEAEYAFFSGFRKAGKDWKIFKEVNKNKIILSKPQKHRVEKWVESYRELPCAVELISGGEAEMSLFGTLCDVPIKVRADYINIEKGYVADVKTTSYGTDPDSFKLVVQNLNYDLSAALYCKMFEQYYGKKFDFYFIVLGKKDIMCEVYKASQATMDHGLMQVMQSLKIYKERKASGNWEVETKLDKFINKDDYEILEI